MPSRRPLSILFLLLSLSLAACGAKKNAPQDPVQTEDARVNRYDKNGIRFIIPADWKVSEEETYEGGFYLACEKTGVNESGIVTVVGFEDSLALPDVLETYASTLRENPVMATGNLRMGDLAPAAYGRFSGTGRTYEMTLLNLPHRGRMTAFYTRSGAVVVAQQEAVEDADNNRAGFEKMAASFEVQ